MHELASHIYNMYVQTIWYAVMNLSSLGAFHSVTSTCRSGDNRQPARLSFHQTYNDTSTIAYVHVYTYIIHYTCTHMAKCRRITILINVRKL